MFQANTWHGRHAFTVPPRGRLGVECEIAARMATDLPRRDAPYELAAMPAAVAASMAAIEVVQDRYVDYPSLDTPTLLAGDVILLGSLVQTQWVQGGDVVAVTNNPLGEVAAQFTAS
jgi:2-keto-4-pentenoate hydratase